MAYRDYWHCPRCRGNYDHGEKCDCKSNKEDLEYENDTKKNAHRELQGVQG